MAKQLRKPRRRAALNVRRASLVPKAQPDKTVRLRSLDALRGLAILLMLIDHVSGVLLAVNIEFTSVRFWTRLSMPLFAVLMGYLWNIERPPKYQRLAQIAFAGLLVNVTYFPRYLELEILVSLLCASLLFWVLRTRFVYLYLIIFLAPWDVSARLLDYPLAIVIPCAALGLILQRSGWRWAAVNSLLALPVVAWLEPPTQYVLYFILPAVLLVAGAAHWRNLGLAPLDILGRYPLTTYVIQYYVIFTLAAWTH